MDLMLSNVHSIKAFLFLTWNTVLAASSHTITFLLAKGFWYDLDRADRKKLEKKSIIIPLFWSYFIIEGEKQGFTVSESHGHPHFGRIVDPSIVHELKPLTKLLSKEKFNRYKERQWKWRQRIIGSLLIYNGKQCGMTNATG